MHDSVPFIRLKPGQKPRQMDVARPVVEVLPDLPVKPLTPQSQLESLQRLQQNAERRLSLGVELFQQALARTSQFESVARELRAEQSKLREEMQADMARGFRQYDQWISDSRKQTEQRLDTLTALQEESQKDFGQQLEHLEARLLQTQEHWIGIGKKVEDMIRRAQRVLDDARTQIQAQATPPVPTPAAEPAVAPIDGAIAPTPFAPSAPLDPLVLFATPLPDIPMESDDQWVRRVQDEIPTPAPARSPARSPAPPLDPMFTPPAVYDLPPAPAALPEFIQNLIPNASQTIVPEALAPATLQPHAKPAEPALSYIELVKILRQKPPSEGAA